MKFTHSNWRPAFLVFFLQSFRKVAVFPEPLQVDVSSMLAFCSIIGPAQLHSSVSCWNKHAPEENNHSTDQDWGGLSCCMHSIVSVPVRHRVYIVRHNTHTHARMHARTHTHILSQPGKHTYPISAPVSGKR